MDMSSASDLDSTVWCFSSSTDDRIKIKVLGVDSAIFFLKLLRPEEYATWFIQKDGGVPEFIANSEMLLCKELPRIPTISDIKIAKGEKKYQEQRKHPRLETKLNVTITRGQSTFTTTTKDISAGGMLMEQNIPEEYLYSVCHFEVVSPDQSLKLEFEARVLQPSVRTARIIFEGVSHKQLHTLKSWIDQRLRKKAA